MWNSSLAIPAFAGMVAGLLAAGLRPGRAAAFGVAGFVFGASPLLVARVIGASGVTAASAVTAIRPRWLWGSGLSDLTQAVTTLFGFRVPLVVDDRRRARCPCSR